MDVSDQEVSEEEEDEDEEGVDEFEVEDEDPMDETLSGREGSGHLSTHSGDGEDSFGSGHNPSPIAMRSVEPDRGAVQSNKRMPVVNLPEYSTDEDVDEDY